MRIPLRSETGRVSPTGADVSGTAVDTLAAAGRMRSPERSLTPTVDDTPGASAATAPRFGYHPSLDGVRAFAIIGVLGFHYVFRGHSIIKGGYLGVDMFFVLSGFLITTLLLAEHTRAHRISLRNFYARRALRLLPLLIVLLVVAVIVNLVLAPRTPGRPTRQGITAAAFYYGNWFRVRNQYGLGFLGATWSLSIEEQFYIVWPILLIGLLRLRLRQATLLAVTLTLAAASAFWRFYLLIAHEQGASFVDFYFRLTGRAHPAVPLVAQEGARSDRVYFATDTRADMLLVGCALAILLAWVGPRLTPFAVRAIRMLGVVASVVVACYLLEVIKFADNGMWKYGAVIFEVMVASVIAALIVAPKSVLTKLLAIPILVWIGRRSYGIYLIHIFVFTFLRQEKTHLGDWASLAFELAVVFVLAALSFRYIETPALRLKDRFGAARAYAPGDVNVVT
jgi:peptidoglycan/LPS O-acetylase OafA/YrhL